VALWGWALLPHQKTPQKRGIKILEEKFALDIEKKKNLAMRPRHLTKLSMSHAATLLPCHHSHSHTSG